MYIIVWFETQMVKILNLFEEVKECILSLIILYPPHERDSIRKVPT